jgi:ribosome-associated translation inhibitor RaiA
MTTIEAVRVRTVRHGRVPEGSGELAVTKIRSVLRHVAQPVLSARVTLTMSADPAVAFPAKAQATVDVNGRIVRAQAAAETMHEAVELMTHRLRAHLDRAVHTSLSRRKAAHQRRLRRQAKGCDGPAAGPSPPRRQGP